MDENLKNKLEEKKKQIQLRIKVDEFIDARLKPWLEIYEIILANNIAHKLVQLDNVSQEEISFWGEKMNSQPFSKFNFDLLTLNTDDEKNIVSQLYDIYPSTYPLRYMPSDIVTSLASGQPNEIIIDFAKQLKVNLDEEVYLMYLYYSPVLKLKLADIINNSAALYDFPMDDILIASPDFSWIIFRSMEEEWRFCYSTAG